MSFDDDWRSLGAAWREAEIGAAPAARRFRNQRLRMVAAIGLELAASLLCTAQLVEIAVRATSARAIAWPLVMLVALWIFQALLLYLRRGQWRTPTLAPGAFIAHTLSRARTAIRLAWLNVGVTIAFASYGLLFVIVHGRDRANHRPFVVLSIASAGFVVAFSLGLRGYIRRQHRTIAAAHALAAELAESAEHEASPAVPPPSRPRDPGGGEPTSP